MGGLEAVKDLYMELAECLCGGLWPPIGRWPRLVQIMKKPGGRKSRWTVPFSAVRSPTLILLYVTDHEVNDLHSIAVILYYSTTHKTSLCIVYNIQ